MAESHLSMAASDLDGGAPARERAYFGEKDQALGDELRPESGTRSMSERKIAVTPSACSYPLLIKHLLHAPLAQTAGQEIVYRDVRRLNRGKFYSSRCSPRRAQVSSTRKRCAGNTATANDRRRHA
jgi:hypothetical protein